MPKVLVLPEYIASQIAAGEVVERPSSAVKELVENAIDAGSTKIVVAISEGCRSIRVADNGFGMNGEDAVLAFQRHATSKLSSADELWNLSTLGFRGEALPSIAAISRVTCFTRTADSTIGTRIEAAEGSIKAVETGCAPGTVIEVADLFYNVPARLNFLKRASTEFGHIHETIQNLAICYPSVSFELLNEGEVKLTTTGSGDFRKAGLEAGHFHGDESLVEISSTEPNLGLSLEARIAKPTHFRGDRKGILSIVNSRPVRCQITYKALDYAYADLIPRGRYPIAVLALRIRASDLDVNIHPTKKEVKYSIGNDIYSFIQRQLIKALRSPTNAAFSQALYSPRTSEEDNGGISTPIGSIVSERPVFEERKPLGVFAQEPRQVVEQQTFRQSLNYQASLPKVRMDGLSAPLDHLPTGSQSGPALPVDWRLIGYLHNTYILVETSQGMLIVEQHIAHERVIYEHLLTQQSLERSQSDDLQRLIISCPLRLTPEQLACLEQHASEMNDLGFDFEQENGKLSCVQVPVELAHRDYPRVVQEILQALSQSEAPNVKLELTKSLACQSAVKNGMVLSEAQIIKLLNDWLNVPRNDTCPHGRPIKLEFSKDKLFRLFHPQG
jgi:DNA mismatch repair protein MutL